MSKVCEKCGAPINENERICEKCQSSVTNEQNIVEKNESSDSNNNKGIIKIVIGVVVALIVVFAYCMVINYYTGYDRMLGILCDAIESKDADTLSELTSSLITKSIDSAGYDTKEYSKKVLDVLHTQYEDEIGEVKDVSYKITDKKEWSEEDKKELFDALFIFDNNIKKIIELDVDITVDGSEKSKDNKDVKLFLLKEKGGWKIVYGGFDFVPVE